MPLSSIRKSAAAAVLASSRLADGIEALKAGELVVYPTETFYGIGADPCSPAALMRLFAAKAREPGRPVGLIAASTAMAFSIAREVPSDAHRLADSFWPGPLTIVMPARDGFAPELIGPDGIAVRVSPHPVARALAAGLGRPITASSANLSGQAPAVTLDAAREPFGEKVKVYFEGGKLMASMPSTVVAVNEIGWKMIRVGAISAEQIEAALAAGVSR